MTFSATLEKQVSLNDEDALQPGPVRATITVTAVTDFLDKGLITNMLNPVTNQYEYNHVAVPTDLRDYNYQQAGGRDFVRVDSVDKFFETAELADEFIEDFEARVQLLCNDMGILQDLGTPTTVVITGV